MPKFGNNIVINVYGESHANCIGVIISGLNKGCFINLEELQQHTDRRKATNSSYSTKRIEPDIIEVKRGLNNGLVVDNEVEFVVYNTNQRSGDYANLVTKPRPSHADYPAMIKYGNKIDLRGGGKYSGRMTLPICIAGGVAEQILSQKGIFIASYLSEVAQIEGQSYRNGIPTVDQLLEAKKNPFYFMSDRMKEIQDNLENARLSLDSLGGIVETVVYGMPVGVGDSLFDGLESQLSAAIFAIPAVKGVEFGLGFSLANLKGSSANDQYFYDDGAVKTFTNNNGGIVGGMTNGSPITIRCVIKPTPSIGIKQNTVDLSTKTNTTIEIKGRHDVCIAPRACAPIESAVAIALLDILTKEAQND